jgi:hypothetical protein
MAPRQRGTGDTPDPNDALAWVAVEAMAAGPEPRSVFELARRMVDAVVAAYERMGAAKAS